MLKIFEIVFVAVAIGVFRAKIQVFHSEDTSYVASGIYVTCLIVTPLLLLCYLIEQTKMQASAFECGINVVLPVLLLCVSIIGFIDFGDMPDNAKTKSAGITISVFSLMAALAYLCDLFFSIKQWQELDIMEQLDKNLRY